MSYVVAACEKIVEYLHPGMLIILESTTYPGQPTSYYAQCSRKPV
jgi:UDP-N-acetyl-D-mannosaminuronate dehydrogenase